MSMHDRKKWEELLSQAPQWALPDDPDAFFELLRSEDLDEQQLDDLLRAAGEFPPDVCERQWNSFQERIGGSSIPSEANAWNAFLQERAVSVCDAPHPWEIGESINKAGRTIQELLNCLLSLGMPYFISTIRFHRYAPDEDKLVSIESAGHEDEKVAMRVRLGNIVKFRVSSPLEWKDSFWAIELGHPVLFQLDESCTPPLEPHATLAGISVISMPYDQCDHVLARHRASIWVDFPLIVGNSVIGKLSCDVSSADVTPEVANSLMEFWKIVQVAAPYIGVCHLKDDRSISVVVRDSWSEIQEIDSLASLFTYITETLPRKLECCYASLFLMSRDSIGSEKLVLKKTSFRKSQFQEDVGHYNLMPGPEPSLTVWVARHARALRLQNLDDEPFLEKQKQIYDPALQWANKIQDSTNHSSFLAVPILIQEPRTCDVVSGAHPGVVGVLRLTEKHRGAHFTEMDERVLMAVARESIGPKLMSLIHKQVSDRLLEDVVQELLQKACELPRRAIQSDPRQALECAFRDVMGSVFPERGAFGRLYLLNFTNSTRSRFRHMAIGGRLGSELRERAHHNYDLGRTLTGRVLDEQGGVVFLNDLPRAQDEGVLLNIQPRAKCAIARRLVGGDTAGAVVVESEGYDIDPECDGRFLELFARHTEGFIEKMKLSRWLNV